MWKEARPWKISGGRIEEHFAAGIVNGRIYKCRQEEGRGRMAMADQTGSIQSLKKNAPIIHNS